jgi:HD-GYP domain-containing protein (c-di-GMP phosphodiesterase class II)
VSFDSYTNPQSETLLRTARERFSSVSRLQRTLITEVAAAAGFLVAAFAVALFAPVDRSFSWPTVAVVAVVFLAARHTNFLVGSASTWPAQLVFIPMLFVLPLRLVPLLAAAIMVLDLVPTFITGNRSLTQKVAQTASRIGDTWYTLGPVAVLLAFSAQRFAWSHWPIYLLAFAAQVGLDAGSGLLRSYCAEGLLPSAQIQMAWLYETDAAMSFAGVQFAAVAERRPGLILLELPVIGLLGMFARERSQRIAGSLALSSAYRGTARLLGDVIEDDDQYTGVHSKAVVDLSVSIADRLELDADTRQRVEFGALLHDVGKIRVSKEILHKPGPLDEAEWAIMRQHTVFGEQMLSQVGGTLAGAGRVIRHSHERWDGLGYPDGLAGTDIPLESRIITTCDAFNAMTTARPYRPAMPTADALAEVARCAGTQFDPAVVKALLAQIAADSGLNGRSDRSAVRSG